jgi:hypothetical protein
MSFEFVTVGSDGSTPVGSRRSRSDEVPKDASNVEISPFPRSQEVAHGQEVAYYHPKGCGGGETDCSLEKIREICHNNAKDDDDFPTDSVFFGQKIRPPFLKGVHHGESVEDDGNTRRLDGKARRTSNRTDKSGTGLCYNDVEDEDGLREWSEKDGSRDPATNAKIVFMSKPTTARQRVRPIFAQAMRAVRRDPDILSIVNPHGDDDFFGSPGRIMRDPETRDWYVREDTHKEYAQKLAEACGARPDENFTDEEKDAFRRVQKDTFDELYRATGRLIDYEPEILFKLERVAEETGFDHGVRLLRDRLSSLFPSTVTEMLLAARMGQHEKLKTILDQIQLSDVEPLSAKLYSEALTSPSSNVDTVRVLVNHQKVDVNAPFTGQVFAAIPPIEGWVPIHMAMAAGANPKPEYFRALLEHPRIDVNKIWDDQGTALFCLAGVDYRLKEDWDRWGPMLTALLDDERTDITAMNADGDTALHSAVISVSPTGVHDEIVVRMLLDAGADPLARNKKGHTPADEARGRRDFALVDLLTASIGTRGSSSEQRVTRAMRANVQKARANLRRGTVRAWLGWDERALNMAFDTTGERLSVGFKRGTNEYGVVRLDADTGLRFWSPGDPHAHVLKPHDSPNVQNELLRMLQPTFSSNGEYVALYGSDSFSYQYAQIFERKAFETEILVGTERNDSSRLSGVSTVSLSGDGKMIAGVFEAYPGPASSSKATVKIWKRDAAGNWTPTPWKTLDVDQVPFTVAFSPDGANLAIGSQVKTYDVASTRVWNLRDQTPGSLVEVAAPFAGGKTARKVAFSADGKLLGIINNENSFEVIATDEDGAWENATGVFAKREVFDFAFNPRESSLLALSVLGEEVELQQVLLNTSESLLLRLFERAKGPLAFSPDGARLAMASESSQGVVVIENVTDALAKAILENEYTRQSINEKEEILKHARDLVIPAVIRDDALWRLGPYLPNLESLSFMLTKGIGAEKKFETARFGLFTSLKVLNLSSLELESLPSGVCDIIGLRELDVYDNKLSTLPDEIENMRNLRLIDLGDNSFTELPAVLAKIPSLRMIRFLDNGGVIKIPEAFRIKTNARLLRIQQHRDSMSSEALFEIQDGRPHVTHTGSQFLAFLHARYDANLTLPVTLEALSERFHSEWNDHQLQDTAFAFALKRIYEYYEDLPNFSTLGQMFPEQKQEGVLSIAGVQEFQRWFLSDDFEQDMRRARERFEDAPSFLISIELRDQILRRFDESGFSD